MSGFQMVKKAYVAQTILYINKKLCLYIKWSRLLNHLKTGLHSKTGHVRFSDPHFIQMLFVHNSNGGLNTRLLIIQNVHNFNGSVSLMSGIQMPNVPEQNTAYLVIQNLRGLTLATPFLKVKEKLKKLYKEQIFSITTFLAV